MAKIKHKTNRAKRISHSCRNNGTCAYCTRARTHNGEKRKQWAKDDIKLYRQEV